MATQTRAIEGMNSPPVMAEAQVSQSQLAEILRLRRELQEAYDRVETAEDVVIEAIYDGATVQPGPLGTFDFNYTRMRGAWNVCHHVVFDGSASEAERIKQYTYWRPGWRHWGAKQINQLKKMARSRMTAVDCG